MVKLVTQIRPKEETDLEQFWNDWRGKYAACFLGQPGLIRYIISRFKEGHGRAKDWKEDQDHLWGMEEFWFQDLQSYEKIQKALLEDKKTKAILDEFQSQLTWKWTAWVEERLIVDSGYTELVKAGENLTKMLVTFRLKEGQDSDDTWKLWIVGHSQHHLNCGVRKYALNRVQKVLEGDANKVWGIPELWYANKEACDYDHRRDEAPGGRNDPKEIQIGKDFHQRTEGNRGVYVEEQVIIF